MRVKQKLTRGVADSPLILDQVRIGGSRSTSPLSLDKQVESHTKSSNLIENSNFSVKLLEREPFLERFYSKVLLSPDRINQSQAKLRTEETRGSEPYLHEAKADRAVNHGFRSAPRATAFYPVAFHGAYQQQNFNEFSDLDSNGFYKVSRRPSGELLLEG